MNEIGLPLLLTTVAGLSTVAGSVFFLLMNDGKHRFLTFFLGLSAGAMLSLGLFDLLPASIRAIGWPLALVMTCLGMAGMGLINRLVPATQSQSKKRLQRIGMVTVVGIAIHNLPEGMAVFMSFFQSQRLGILLALATGIHNIPEGIAATAPFFYATRNKSRALTYALLAGLAEPLGAVVAYVLLQPFLSLQLLGGLFGVITGIMVFISLDELMPCCFAKGYAVQPVWGILLGMGLVALSLQLL